MQRRLSPEILDTLPADHPAALHNRRDLRLINRAMGNWRWFERELPPRVRPGERVLEIGSGMGELGVRLAARGVLVDGLDRWPPPARWPNGARWHQTDVQDFTSWPDYHVIIGNLILHQFDTAIIEALARQFVPHARVLAFSEPSRRRYLQRVFAAACPLLGANYVSRHDGHVSIEAGFRAEELPQLLGLDPQVWRWRVTEHTLGAYRLLAEKRA